jgi:hypothetical protein
MTEPSTILKPDELIPLIRGITIQKISSSSERFNERQPIGAQLNTGMGHEMTDNAIHFRIDYQLILKCEPLDGADVVGILQSSVVVAYQTDNPPHTLWTDAAHQLNQMAAIAGHPYLRQSISLQASELSFPNITIGILKYGSSLAESVTIGDRLYPFAIEPADETNIALPAND